MKWLELFAGAGGAALGIRDAGGECLAAVEWDADAASTLKAAGFPSVLADVRGYVEAIAWPPPWILPGQMFPIPSFDLVQVAAMWASFPCQCWSTAGSRLGARDPRNGWPWTVDAIDTTAPTWFVAENVPGLTQHSPEFCLRTRHGGTVSVLQTGGMDGEADRQNHRPEGVCAAEDERSPTGGRQGVCVRAPARSGEDAAKGTEAGRGGSPQEQQQVRQQVGEPGGVRVKVRAPATPRRGEPEGAQEASRAAECGDRLPLRVRRQVPEVRQVEAPANVATRPPSQGEGEIRCAGCYLERVILPQLRERFAWVEMWRLNAADFGVPQHRRRIFLVAGPRAVEQPKPTHAEDGAGGLLPWATFGEALDLNGGAIHDEAGAGMRERDGREPVSHPDTEPAPAIRARSKGAAPLYVLDGGRNSEANPNQEQGALSAAPAPAVGGKGNQMLRAIGGGRNPQAAGIERTYRDLTNEPATTVAAVQIGNAGPFICDEAAARAMLDRPSPAVTTGGVKGSTLRERSDGRPRVNRASDALDMATGRRRLTTAECAILQDFPADHPWHGTSTSIYRQIGNAVPPRLAAAVAGAIEGSQ